MNRQGNTYTVLYSVGLVLVVGVVLSLVYQALRPRQEENIANDTKKQILAAARIVPENGESVGELYKKYITDEYVVNSKGEKVESAVPAFRIDVAAQVKLPDDERLLPVFVCSTEKDGTKYILPVYGAGLWGPIWGYIAFDADGSTIYGAYFAHQGETPGLGAEIEKPAFSSQFDGKRILGAGGEFEPISIVKAGQKAPGEYVNAVSGGTITSQGVQAMLANSLKPYAAFLKNLSSR